MAGDTLERFAEDGGLPSDKMKMSLPRRLFLRAAFRFNHLMVSIFGRKNLPDTENAYRFLRGAARLAPVFLSLGNHEEALLPEDLAFLAENGITLLDNADAALTLHGVPLCVGGLSTVADEAWLERFSRKDGCKLLLCHHPAYYDSMVAGRDIDLTLAGHNHGGQIRLFGRALFCAGGGLFPKYARGVYHDRMVVTAGCANTVAMPRWGNPRELVLVNLIPQE